MLMEVARNLSGEDSASDEWQDSVTGFELQFKVYSIAKISM